MNNKLIKLTEGDIHRIVKESIQNIVGKNIGYKESDETSNKSQIDTPWSEYDEVMLYTAKKIIWESDETSDGTAYKVIEWLKSIKNRIQSK
jgi:hypothetical protein